MKKTYMAPEVEVCKISAESLICLSGGPLGGGGGTDGLGTDPIVGDIKRRNVEEMEDLW